jgi:biopolymer transport protein TolR
MSYKPKAPPVMAAPNVIPMAVIMLVLLIIFMVITPMMHQGKDVNMAKAETAEKMPYADRENAIIVAITRDGNYFLSPGNVEVSHEALGDDVKNLVAGRIDTTVYVRSDARAKYSDLVSAVDEIHAAGIERIGLLTEKVPAKPAPAPPPGAMN